MQDEHKLHCFGCDKTYDIFDLVKEFEHITDFKEAKKFICDKYDIQDTQYIQNISNNKDIKHKQDIPQDAKIIPFKAPAEEQQEQEQKQQKQYDFTKIIQSLYDEQTEEHKQHFKDRRTYRQNY